MSKETILREVTGSHLEIEEFKIATLGVLIEKLRSLRDSDEFIEEAEKKILNEQLESAIESKEKANTVKEIMQMIIEIMNMAGKDSSEGGESQ